MGIHKFLQVHLVLFVTVVTNAIPLLSQTDDDLPFVNQPMQVLQSPSMQHLPTPDNLEEEFDFDEFGASIAIHGDLALIGAASAKHVVDDKQLVAGRAFLFDLKTNKLLLTLEDPSPQERGLFGGSVALNGEYALVSSTNSVELYDIRIRTLGLAKHVFTISVHNPEDTWWGRRAAVGFWENRFLVHNGAPDADNGRKDIVEIYDLATKEKVAEIKDPDASPAYGFGLKIAIDGDQILIGSPHADVTDDKPRGAGAAYLFDLKTLSFLRKFTLPDPNSKLYAFGTAITLHNGGILISGRYETGGAIPEVYYFDAGSGELLHTFPAENNTQQFWYGENVTRTKERIFISYSHNPFLRQAILRNKPIEPNLILPTIYVYDRKTQKLLYRLTNQDPEFAHHEFGGSVAATEDWMLVGVKHNNIYNPGAAFKTLRQRGETRVFSRPSEREDWE